MLRVLVALIAILAGLGGEVTAAGPTFEDVPVPGGIVAMARGIGLKTPPDPPRFVAEIARLIHGLPEGHVDQPSSPLKRLEAQLEITARLQGIISDLPDGTVTLVSTERTQRARLQTLLELLGLRIRETRGALSVESNGDRTAAARAPALTALGVDPGDIAKRLNAGDSVQVKVLTDLVPIPLTSAWWSDAVFHKPVKAEDLFAAIVGNPRPALLCHGLAALDDETLEYVSSNRRLVDFLGGDAAPLFAAFASNIQVRDGRVVPPGGDDAVVLWEAVVGEKVTRPDAFIRALLTVADGRLAYFYDLVSELDAPRARFALGLELKAASRVERFKALVSSVDASSIDWRVRERPFSRRLDDIAWLLLNVVVDADGVPQGPGARRFWERVFESGDVPATAAEATKLLSNLVAVDRVDAAWLAETVLNGDPKLRHSRLEQLGFGFRAFRTTPADELGEALTAIRALPDLPAVILTLERMGATTPAVYAASARASVRLSSLEGPAAYTALAQYQGALALISSMCLSGGLDPARANTLTGSLAAVGIGNGYGPRLASWVREQWLPALAARPGAEDTVLAALAGANVRPSAELPRITWEGERYRLDLTTSELRRLRAQRERQRGVTIDAALVLERAARDLGSEALDLDTVQKTTATLRDLLPQLGGANILASKPVGLAPSAQELPVPRTALERIVKELTGINKPTDARKAESLAAPLGELSGIVLGSALTGVAYAVHLGDASDEARLDVDLARRHDFGLDLKADRQSTAWLVPRQSVTPGSPRRVVGSLLGLDVALASLALRRVGLDSSGNPPVLLSNDRITFTTSVSVLNPHALRDADRDAIAAGIEKGRARVNAAATVGPAALNTLVGEISMDGWRRRATQWEIQHRSTNLLSLFSLNELLSLGGGATPGLNAWGMASAPLSGCLCSHLPAPNAARLVMGRPQLGVMASAVADVHLRVAVMLSALKLPAPVAKSVLGAIVLTFVDEAQPNDPGDWLTLVRAASSVSRERIEDALAGTTATGPLVPEDSYQDRR